VVVAASATRSMTVLEELEALTIVARSENGKLDFKASR